MSRHVVATSTCVTATADGQRVRLTAGVVWSADDPIVLSHPELFRALDDGARPRRKVEQATAAPGEVRRQTGRATDKAD